VGTVFYQFRPDGHGYRIFHGRLEQFRSELDEGYPNVIRVFTDDAGDAAARTGLVQVTGRELRLELGEPGSNGPRQPAGRRWSFTRRRPVTRREAAATDRRPAEGASRGGAHSAPTERQRSVVMWGT
jgi:hypothetical protein